MSAPVTFEVEVESHGVQIEVGAPQVPVSADVYPRVVVAAAPGSRGPQGAPGGGTVERIAAVTLSGHRVVTPRNDGTVEYADASEVAHLNRPLWFTMGAWSAGDTATLVAAGPLTEPSWSWIPGTPIYLGVNGFLTQTMPVDVAFIRIVAEVIEPTVIEFRPYPPIAQ